jgi:type I restriction enzyme, S subunit
MSGRAATDRIIRGKHAISVNDPGHPTPPGWVRTLLTDVAELGTGHTPSRLHPEYWDGEIGWIGIRDAGKHHGGVIHDTDQHISQLGIENSAARLLPKDTVCLSRTASVGYVVKMGKPMATSQDFVAWTCGEALEPDFLKAALLAEGSNIRSFGEGSTHTTVYFPAVKAFHIDLPPRSEQQRVVAKLDALTARLARARLELDSVSELTAHFRKSVLGNCFNELDGTTVELGTLLSAVEAGKNLRCEERPPRDGERGVVKVSAVTWGFFDASQSKTLPDSYLPPEKTQICKGDLLISRANTLELVGAVALVESQPRELYLSDKILRLVVDAASKSWIMWFLRSPQGRRQIEAYASGNQLSMRNISQEALRRIQLPFPDPKTRVERIEGLEAAFASINRVDAEAMRARALLERLESAILAKAFRGELVPQDPNDEPASVLLERIRAQRAAVPQTKRGRRVKE